MTTKARRTTKVDEAREKRRASYLNRFHQFTLRCVQCGTLHEATFTAPNAKHSRTFLCSDACRKERKKERDRKSYRKNSDRINRRTAERLSNDPKRRERKRETAKAWRERNRAALLAKKALYRESVRGRCAILAYRARPETKARIAAYNARADVRERMREWYQNHRSALPTVRRCPHCGEHFASIGPRKLHPECVAEWKRLKANIKRKPVTAQQRLRNRILSFQRYPRDLPKIMQRRREGAFAYFLLCDTGAIKPVKLGDPKRIRKAHREARRVFAENGMLPMLSAAMAYASGDS